MKRGLVIGLAAAAVVVVLAWYLLLFSPTSKDLDDTREQVSEQERQRQDLQATVRRLEALARNAPEQQARLAQLAAAIPENPDLAEFIIQANEIAVTSGIDWLSISPSPPAASTTPVAGAAGASTITVSMQVEGGFYQVLDYLNRLEDLERLVIVDSVNISTSSTAEAGGTTGSSTASLGGAPQLGVTLAGRMFTRAAPASAGGTTTTTTTTPGGSTTTTVPGGSTTTTTGGSSSTTATTGAPS